MRKSIVTSLGGAALLTLGMFAGVIAGPSLQALAAGKPAAKTSVVQPIVAKGDYCALYEGTLAKNLGVSQSKLVSANKVALQTVINQLAADGTITPSQKAQAEQALAKYGSNPCAALKQAAAKARTGKGTAIQNQAVTAAKTAIETATAKTLNLSLTTLQSDLASGKTVSQLITAQHAQKSAVDAAYLGAARTELKQAVASGLLTQAESNLAYSYVTTLVAQGHYPLLDKSGANMGAFAGLK